MCQFYSKYLEKFDTNVTHREKLSFTQSSARNVWLAASDLFRKFTQSIKVSIHSIIIYQEYRYLKNVIHQIDSKNEWFLLSASFTAKLT